MSENSNQISFKKWLPALVVALVIFASLTVFARSFKGTASRNQTAQQSDAAAPTQMLTAGERNFLTALSENMKNAPMTETRINSIIQKLETSAKLEQVDYDFLMYLSQRMNNPTISKLLTAIADNHRP
jgi:hypothetical protein